MRKREKQASTLATFVVTRGRCEPISSLGPSYCLLSLNPSQWSVVVVVVCVVVGVVVVGIVVGVVVVVVGVVVVVDRCWPY